MSGRDLAHTRRDLRHTPVAEEFIAARARRGARRKTVGTVDVIVLEARRSAVDLALVRARAARDPNARCGAALGDGLVCGLRRGHDGGHALSGVTWTPAGSEVRL